MPRPAAAGCYRGDGPVRLRVVDVDDADRAGLVGGGGAGVTQVGFAASGATGEEIDAVVDDRGDGGGAASGGGPQAGALYAGFGPGWPVGVERGVADGVGEETGVGCAVDGEVLVVAAVGVGCGDGEGEVIGNAARVTVTPLTDLLAVAVVQEFGSIASQVGWRVTSPPTALTLGSATIAECARGSRPRSSVAARSMPGW